MDSGCIGTFGGFLSNGSSSGSPLDAIFSKSRRVLLRDACMLTLCTYIVRGSSSFKRHNPSDRNCQQKHESSV